MFVFFGRSEKQDGRLGFWLAETFLTSPPKRLNGIQRYLNWSKTSTFPTKFVFFGPSSKRKWPIRKKGGTLYSGAGLVSDSDVLSFIHPSCTCDDYPFLYQPAVLKTFLLPLTQVFCHFWRKTLNTYFHPGLIWLNAIVLSVEEALKAYSKRWCLKEGVTSKMNIYA